ncbi:MAG TPA: hypothetical protein VFG56_02045, partial [Candidatus Saccharimonadales bacterium]|nr:hypothetical protein [Candidatus Saccharimonadales bacterium]
GNPLGGRGNRFKRGVGSGAAFIGGYKSRREFKHNQQDESVKRAHQNAMADQLLDNNSRFARRAAGVAGDEGVERVRATAIETVMRRGNERKENVEKLQGAFARLSPFAAQAYADSVENGQFSRAKLDQEISRRIADGQINHADAEELERVANFGSAMTPAAMAAATGSLARSGFLQTSHIRNAEKAIRDHKQMSGGEKQIALDQLAGNINDAAKQSGLAQHMRWGVVGGELLQNGQDFDQNEALSQLSAAEQQQYAELTYQAAGNIADMTEEQKLTAGNQAAALIAKGQAEVETRLGFQKLSSAASISRKAYKDGGSEAFAKTMNEDKNFNTDVILTAAGARGQMSSQDRSALEEQAREVVEARGGVWDEVVNEARQKAGLFSRDSSGPGPTPPTGTQPTNPTPPTGP